MTSEEKNQQTRSEQTEKSKQDSSEKSLLSFIKERQGDQDRQAASKVSDITGRLPTRLVDDVDDSDRPGLDQALMRLGGNGF